MTRFRSAAIRSKQFQGENVDSFRLPEGDRLDMISVKINEDWMADTQAASNDIVL